MAYQSTTISKSIPKINTSMFLPGIQREFVWDEKQIRKLFDSVIRGYPIGSFLYWKVRGDKADEQIKYRFIEDYICEGTFPDEFDDRKHHNEKVRDEFSDIPNELTLVLDGQQRLSSFYIGLKGSYTDRQYRKRRKNPESWSRKKLYINLLSNPDEESDDGLSMKYDVRFKEPTPGHSANQYWYPVGNILDVDVNEKYNLQQKVIDELKDSGLPPSEIPQNHINRNINELWRSIHKDNIINYYVLEETDQNKILDIFIRANEGGTQLSKEEILLSMATSRWTETNPPIDARKSITTLVEKLNGHNPEAGFNFGVGYILKNILYMSDIQMDYNVQTFSKENLEIMKQTWLDEDFSDSLKMSLDLLDTYGFDDRAVNTTAILPINYFFYMNHSSINLGWDSEEGREIRRQIFYWLSTTILKGVYQSRTDTLLTGVRNVFQDTEKGKFPLKELNEKLLAYGESLGFLEEEVDEIIRTMNYGSRKAIVFLSLLYYPDPANEHEKHSMDHIFPKNLLKSETLVDNYDISPEKASRYESLKDDVRNLQLLTPQENSEKSDLEFREWLNGRKESNNDRHFIPENSELYQIEEYEQFLNERGKLMKQHVLNNYGMSDEIEQQIER